jgi:sporulation protein YunB
MLSRHRKNTKALIIAAVVFLFLVILFYKIDRDIRPVLFAATNAEVKIMATETINKIVKDELSQSVKYSDFVSVRTDKNGDISSIDLNTVEMNKFGSQRALKVQEQLKSQGDRGVSIPLGVITNSTLLSYYGPRMNIKVLPVGYVTCDFKSELQSAGINQTRYMVYIKVDTNMQVLIPLGKENMNVASTIPIAETLIVGKVPDYYFGKSSGSNDGSGVIPVPVPGNN